MTYPTSSYRIISHRIISYPILSYPSHPVLSRVISSPYVICDTMHPATVHHLLYLALILLLRCLLSHQALHDYQPLPLDSFYPILSCPTLSHLILSYPTLSHPVLSYSILSHPVLSYYILFQSNPYLPHFFPQRDRNGQRVTAGEAESQSVAGTRYVP